MKFNENDLVLIRLTNKITHSYKQRHYNVWLRVLFIDNDNTFTGKVERKDNEYELHNVNENITLNSDKVLEVFNENDGMDWCYSDLVTRCDCPGLCRNK